MTSTSVGMDVTASSLIINPLSPGSLCKWLAWFPQNMRVIGQLEFYIQQQFLLEEEFKSPNVICKASLDLASEIVAEYCPCQPIGEEWSSLRVTVQRCEHRRMFHCGKIFRASEAATVLSWIFSSFHELFYLIYLLWILFWYDLKWIFMPSSPRVCPMQ